MVNDNGVTGRSPKELLRATSPFASESRARSWWYMGSVTVLLAAALATAALAPWWPLQLAAALLSSLLMVRAFIMCHDCMHGSMLRDSRLAEAIVFLLGMLLLTPPRSWRHSHNFHHSHVGDLEGTSTGSFPIMTTEMWEQASFWQRFYYRIARHPLSILFAYVTVFMLNVCLMSLLNDPRKYWDSAVAIAAHGGIIAGLWIFAGPDVLIFAFVIPTVLASALGAYLFYAQHNFPGVRIPAPDHWEYTEAALESSSYMDLGPVMRHFTANIGYHHVHHLNPQIPFYRLPEAMAAVPELQQPSVTSLSPRDVIACLRLKLWDTASQRMVSFRDARKLATARA